MTHEHKGKIRAEVLRLIDEGQSQAGIANRCGLNARFINSIVNHPDDTALKDHHWSMVATALSIELEGWQMVETANSRRIRQVLTDAKHCSLFTAIAHCAGSGKSLTCRAYATENSRNNVYLCRVIHPGTSRLAFMKLLARMMGINPGRKVANELADEIIETFVQRLAYKPLLIVDEADKLSDKAWCFFISLYNATEGRMGCVITGADGLRQHIKRGVLAQKIGFDEIDSRFCRSYIALPGLSEAEIKAIATANGVETGHQAELIKAVPPALTYEEGRNRKVWQDARPVVRRIMIHRLEQEEQQVA
jgi:hypothetical protein